VSIIERISANGGEVIRDGWRFKIRRGRLSEDALKWIAAHRTKLCLEVWPEYDDFEERAAIMEFDGGLDRDEAEELAYAHVMGVL